MNKANLKSYAPQARKDFIAAVTARANLLGLSDKAGTLEVAPAQTQGDVTVIAGQAWPAKVSGQRDQLIERIRKDGFAHTMEAVAYTWFNRFAALRYMELHDYLGHGHRALSSTSGGLPDILTHATDLTSELPGLNAAKVTELKLAGNRDGELYRMLLVAQCNALSRAMPFLFERIDDDSELLLPDNLLRSDSVIAKLVEEIPEEDWAEVEIIGWLYQFYISEKKDQVIGKVVKSEDIPAATQLFTPNWIVQYLVQNSVGRLWLLANPHSTLAKEWPYYITPAEQTPEVQAQLDALIQTRVREDGDTLNPESITVLDPACGSGHILVVAYDVLKAIYLERGYQPRAIPRLILEKNLYGLDIDDRAAQMAGFALLMKARADDRRLFTATDDAGNLQPPKLNVLALQSSEGMNAQALAQALQADLHSSNGGNPVVSEFARDDLFPDTHRQMTLNESGQSSTATAGRTDTATSGIESAIAALIETFVHAKTFGSLIQISPQRSSNVRELLSIVKQAKQSGDLYAQAAAQDLLPLLLQAQVLAMQFDAVVANPPYMGSKFFQPSLKQYIEENYSNSKGDLYTCFIVRNLLSTRHCGFIGMITIPNWMFLSSYESLRKWLFEEAAIDTFCHNGRGMFGSDFGSCAFTFLRFNAPQMVGKFRRLFDRQGSVASPEEIGSRFSSCKEYLASTAGFHEIPGAPVSYWISLPVRSTFTTFAPFDQYATPAVGLNTGNNDLFLRLWHEVSQEKVEYTCTNLDDTKTNGKKWYPYNKGGEFRKWYGNSHYLVNWECDGQDVKSLAVVRNKGKHWSRYIQNLHWMLKPGMTWSATSSSYFGVRFTDPGFLFDVKGSSAFCTDDSTEALLGFLTSKLVSHYLQFLNPTIEFQTGDIRRLPVADAIIQPGSTRAMLRENVLECIGDARQDWAAFETAWSFARAPLLPKKSRVGTLATSWDHLKTLRETAVSRMKFLEEQNNSILISAYGIVGELTPEVPEDQITLARADREKDCQCLISYAIGCMMGRYSLDEPGLIYAHAGNVGFEPGRYATFPSDADGIVPITDELWFDDDACSRIREFLRAVWGPDTLEENMAWLAESLGTKASETPDETIRRYIADKFFRDHLQTYKKRPIYWLFSSGKQGAFQALVYLHRYHEGTLARLRAEYVVPLTGKIQSRIEMLQKDALAASSTAARNKLAKEVEKLKKKHVELLAYDEQLRHYADMRITLDLDDGVKVNYGNFGDLLEGVKAVTGGAGDE